MKDQSHRLSSLFSRIQALYDEIVSEFPEFEEKGIAARLEQERKYFDTAQGFHKIAVVGCRGAGKTTLIKALFFNRGISSLDLPTGGESTQVPTLVRLIPGYQGSPLVHADMIKRSDFMEAFHALLGEISSVASLERPNFKHFSLVSFSSWVKEIALPALKKSGTDLSRSLQQRLQEAPHILKTLDPGYQLPAIETVSMALSAIKDLKASYALRSVSLSTTAKNMANPLQIVDFPPMEGANLVHRHFTDQFLTQEADAVLVVIDSQKHSFHEQEHLLFQKISALKQEEKIFFLFNKWYEGDRSGGEKAVRELLTTYHFQAQNVFRISALPVLMYLQEKAGNDVEHQYHGKQQTWTVAKYREARQIFGAKLIEKLGVSDFNDFLDYYFEKSLPLSHCKKHGTDLDSLLSSISKSLEEMAVHLQETDSDFYAGISKCHEALDNFKENVQGIERRMDQFASALQESMAKWSDVRLPAETPQPGKLSRLLTKIGIKKAPFPLPPPTRKKRALDIPASMQESVMFDEDDPSWFEEDTSEIMLPQHPPDMMAYLEQEIFPSLDIHERMLAIVHNTPGRGTIRSHEIEMGIISDFHRLLHSKFLESVSRMVQYHLESFRRTVDNEGYLDQVHKILVQFNLHLYIQPQRQFDFFIEKCKGRLVSVCEGVVGKAIQKLDEIGAYSERLNKIAQMPTLTKPQCSKKQKTLLAYLRPKYELSFPRVLETINREGRKILEDAISKEKGLLIGASSGQGAFVTRVLEKRKAMEEKGEAYDLSIFERMERSLQEKFAIIRETTKEETESKVTQRSSKISDYQIKIQEFARSTQKFIAPSP